MTDLPIHNGQKFGFIGIMGPTNAGKSTFLNRVLGQKIAIVTPKVQTTRNRILGIKNTGQTQMAFFDTPGLFRPKRLLDEAMLGTAWNSIDGVDLVLFFLDATEKRDYGSEFYQQIWDKLKSFPGKIALVLNKVDAVQKGRLLELTTELNGYYPFFANFMISALKGDGIDELLAALTERLPEGPWMYDENQITNLPKQLFAAEITREKLYLKLRQELPYALTVQTEKWEDRPDGSIKIDQVIYVSKANHKGIILGHQGQGIKEIGRLAREELSHLLEVPVHLFLFVKVKEKWDQDRALLEEIGIDLK